MEERIPSREVLLRLARVGVSYQPSGLGTDADKWVKTPEDERRYEEACRRIQRQIHEAVSSG